MKLSRGVNDLEVNDFFMFWIYILGIIYIIITPILLFILFFISIIVILLICTYINILYLFSRDKNIKCY